MVKGTTREILFRGKRIDNDEWVEGYYVYDESGQTTEEPTAYICYLNRHPCGWSLIPYKVIPESVGQYTGLNDKNNAKIFEDDIVEGSDFTPEDCGYGTIAFDDGAFEVSGYDIVGTFHDNYYGKEFEVIGNVFDNADLLEENSNEI